MSDAITLAAAAERSSQSNNRRRGSNAGIGGMILGMVDGLAKMFLLPLQIALSVLSLPGQVLGVLVGYVEDVVGKKVRREMKTAVGDGRGKKGMMNPSGGAGGGGGQCK